MKWYKNPLKVFTFGLFVYALGAIAFNLRLPVGALTATIILGSVIGYFALQNWQPRQHLLSNTVVTTLIALLLVNPSFELSWHAAGWTLLAGLLVVLAKLGPKYKRQLIFNPAALGLLIWSGLLVLVYGSQSLLPSFVSWWGADYAAPYPLLLLIPLILYGGYKFRKMPLLLTFLGFNALWIMVSSGVGELIYPYTSCMIYFLAGVMLIEPKSSPVKWYTQVVAGLVAVLVYRSIGSLGFMNVELWAIMAVNVVHLLSRSKLVNYLGNFKSENA